MLAVTLREEYESRVYAVEAEGLDEARYGQQVREGGGQGGRPAAGVDQRAPKCHHVHYLCRNRSNSTVSN